MHERWRELRTWFVPFLDRLDLLLLLGDGLLRRLSVRRRCWLVEFAPYDVTEAIGGRLGKQLGEIAIAGLPRLSGKRE